MKVGEYEIKVSKRYPMNITVSYGGTNLGYHSDIFLALKSIIKREAYLGMEGNDDTPDSLLEKIEGLCNRLETATVGGIKQEMKGFNLSYSKLYNLCTDYYCKDVTVKKFVEELRPLLGIDLKEAKMLSQKRRTKAK